MRPAPPTESTTPAQPPSKTRRKFFWRPALVVFFATTVIAAGLLIPSSSEPEYHGITLSKWLERYYNNEDAEPQRAEAAEAVRCIGSKAIPILRKWAAATDSPLKQKMEKWAHNLGVSLDLTAAEDYHERAHLGFRLLGETNSAEIVAQKTGVK